MNLEKIIIVGAGVAGVNAATKLIDSGHPGKNITIIDMGKDPYGMLVQITYTKLVKIGMIF